jgi:hypothetical protein
MRDDGFDIDFPNLEKIEGALQYLKNNKEAVEKRWTLSGGCIT